jgi:hypothetical protein
MGAGWEIHTSGAGAPDIWYVAIPICPKRWKRWRISLGLLSIAVASGVNYRPETSRAWE